MQKKQGALTEQCCECGNCIIICPAHAIEFRSETPFYRRATVNGSLCIGCGRCEQACPAINPVEKHLPLATYGAFSKRKEAGKSSSGGMFLELALEVIAEGGVVVGAAYQSDWSVSQQMISKREDIEILQGSKYVKSDIGDSFQKTKERLIQGQKVLYSGTPCQIAALYRFLGEKLSQCQELITVDLVCHGTPPSQLFKDYIATLEKKEGGKVEGFSFRGKKFGHKHVGHYVIRKRGKSKKKTMFSTENSYFWMFLDGCIYNNECYSCSYARPERVADFTICDFWGWRGELQSAMKELNISEDISMSAVLLHTKKAENLFDKIKENMICTSVEYTQVIRHNPQMKNPSINRQDEREEIIREYERMGYAGVEHYFKRKTNLKRYILRITCMIPQKWKNRIKRLLRLG